MGASSSKAVDVCSRLVGSSEQDIQFSKDGPAVLEERASSPSASVSSEDQGGRVSPRSEEGQDGLDLRRLNSSGYDLVSAKSSAMVEQEQGTDSAIPALTISLEENEVKKVEPELVQTPEGGCDLPSIDTSAIEREIDTATAELHARTLAVEALAEERAEVLRALAALREECASNERSFLEESVERARHVPAE